MFLSKSCTERQVGDAQTDTKLCSQARVWQSQDWVYILFCISVQVSSSKALGIFFKSYSESDSVFSMGSVGEPTMQPVQQGGNSAMSGEKREKAQLGKCHRSRLLLMPV